MKLVTPEGEDFGTDIMTATHIGEVHYSLGGPIADFGLGGAGCKLLSGDVA